MGELGCTKAGGNGERLFSGAYVGNGRWGQDAPNRLSFPFQPKLLIIFEGTSLAEGYPPTMWLWGITVRRPSYTTANQRFVTISYSKNTVSWYVEQNNYANATDQLNAAGTVYGYLALG